MFKREFGFLAALLLLVIVPMMGQEEVEEFDDYTIGGGGPFFGWLSLELEELNEVLQQAGYAAFPEGFFVFGGSGFGGLVEGIRMGGSGAGGDVSTIQEEKIAKLEIGYGGFELSFGILHGDNYDISIGTILGGGEAVLTLLASRPDTFAEAIETPSSVVLSRAFFLLQPKVNLGFKLFDFVNLRLSGSYLVSFSDPWKQRSTELPGPPSEFKGWFVELGFDFGESD